MNLKKSLTFLLITFLWSWTLWIVGLDHLKEGITQESINTFLTYFFAGVYGPTISSLITTLIFDGFQGMVALIKKLVIWRVPIKNYLFIVGAPIIFVLIGIGLYSLLVGAIGSFDFKAYLAIPTVLWAGLYAGPLGEELGWRGFLLPEFQKGFSNLRSAIFIGIIWFAWHIPLFWAPFGTLVSGGPITFLPVVTYLVMLICLSLMITWLVINSKGSVLVAVLFHLSINAGIALLFFPELAKDFKIVHLLSSVGMLLFTGFLIAKNKMNVSDNKQ